MATTHDAPDHPILPNMMRPDDARIPQRIRACLGNYDRAIASVGPVIGIDLTEWMLFDANHAVVDVLFDGTRTDGTY